MADLLKNVSQELGEAIKFLFSVSGDTELVVALFAFPCPVGPGWAHDGGGEGTDGSGAVRAFH